MNEEQLADALSEYLDAFLEGESLPESTPLEIAELLPVADTLSQAAPAPRPEFGPALKESVLGSISGGNGGTGSGGSTFGGYFPIIVIVGLLILATVLGLLGIAAIVDLSPLTFNETSPIRPSVDTQLAPVQPTQSPQYPTPLRPQPTVTGSATLSPTAPASSPTVVLDILPPITATIETTEDFLLPPPLEPGSSTSDENDGDSSGGRRSGDHNRGHGNDPDHHDEDNPGRTK